MSIIYGDSDWMDSRGSAHIVKQNPDFKEGTCNLYILERSGHRMFSMNPDGFVQIVIDDVFGHRKHVMEVRKPCIIYTDENG